MKRIVLSLAIFTALSVNSFAQSSDKDSKSKMPPHLRELNLSSDQETQLDALRQQYREKREALNTQYESDMKKILTPEQVTKLESMQKSRSNDDRKGNGKRGKNHKGKGKKDHMKLNDTTKKQLDDLKVDYEQKKSSIEKSRVAPETQKQQLAALDEQYRADQRRIFDTARKDSTMQRPASVKAWMDIAPNSNN